MSKLIGRKVLVRTYSAGVHFGTLSDLSENAKVATLTDSRRVWYWSGAASLSQMAVEGVTDPDDCKFAMTVPEIILSEAIEIIQLTDAAIVNLENVPVWKR